MRIASVIELGEGRFEVTRRRKDGTLIDIAVTMSAVRNSEGDAVGIAAIAQDITDRRRAAVEQHPHEDERVGDGDVARRVRDFDGEAAAEQHDEQREDAEPEVERPGRYPEDGVGEAGRADRDDGPCVVCEKALSLHALKREPGEGTVPSHHNLKRVE
jgi:hypothetical protein